MEGYFKNLYKYVTYETGKVILEKQTIRFSKPRVFNDPLDCYDGLIEIDGTHIPRMVERKFPLASKKEIERLVSLALYNFRKKEKDIMNLFTEERDKVLIACFSKSPEKLLMWSYYTQSHKGMCFQFYVDHQAPFPPYGKVLPLEVNYKSLIEKVKYTHGSAKYLIDWATTKSDKWINEEEVRWVLMDVNDSRDYVDLKFPKYYLKKIIFGYNLIQKDRDKVIEIVNECFQESYIEFSEIIIDETEMDIKEIPYNPKVSNK